MLDRFLIMSQLEGTVLFQNPQDCLKISRLPTEKTSKGGCNLWSLTAAFVLFLRMC